ncbi:manganese efflux pump [Anaerofustis sp. NSJ-163]|nr:manganese efflux pump [Anaerofustis sp. NSJ-163]MCO8194232.1 manganese efflux pump MntP family protein [Anaerofustis sp. NSJ-163]
MGFISLFLIAVVLSMDAFSVCLCIGMSKNINTRQVLKVSLFFSFFQGLMPIIGYMLAINFSTKISHIDNIIIFFLLSFIGVKMLFESFKEKENKKYYSLPLLKILYLSLSVSIDALAIGISFAFMNIKIIPAIILIAQTTFLMSIIGILSGSFLGKILKNKGETLAGIILIIIGIKALFE